MGFSFTSLAVKDGTRDAVLAGLGLCGANTHEEIPESDITGATLPSGWYLVTANRGYPAFAEDATLKRLSQTAEVVTCFVEEHVMCSAASMWSDGRQVWSVMHEADQGIEHLETKGSLPPMFAPISQRLRAEQTAAGGDKAKVDHIFDIPVEIVAQLTGYRHDRLMPELGERAFEVLATTEATPKRSWLRKLLGV
jgi:tRNA(Arg) A34 adenosine deaminase TadA